VGICRDGLSEEEILRNLIPHLYTPFSQISAEISAGINLSAQYFLPQYYFLLNNSANSRLLPIILRKITIQWPKLTKPYSFN